MLTLDENVRLNRPGIFKGALGYAAGRLVRSEVGVPSYKPCIHDKLESRN